MACHDTKSLTNCSSSGSNAIFHGNQKFCSRQGSKTTEQHEFQVRLLYEILSTCRLATTRGIYLLYCTGLSCASFVCVRRTFGSRRRCPNIVMPVFLRNMKNTSSQASIIAMECAHCSHRVNVRFGPLFIKIGLPQDLAWHENYR